MKVMDQKRYAAMCAKRFMGHDMGHFGGTTARQAELDDSLINSLRMKAALERFGRALAAQYDRTGSNAEIVGVELHSINFSLITVPRDPERGD